MDSITLPELQKVSGPFIFFLSLVVHIFPQQNNSQASRLSPVKPTTSLKMMVTLSYSCAIRGSPVLTVSDTTNTCQPWQDQKDMIEYPEHDHSIVVISVLGKTVHSMSRVKLFVHRKHCKTSTGGTAKIKSMALLYYHIDNRMTYMKPSTLASASGISAIWQGLSFPKLRVY